MVLPCRGFVEARASFRLSRGRTATASTLHASQGSRGERGDVAVVGGFGWSLKTRSCGKTGNKLRIAGHSAIFLFDLLFLVVYSVYKDFFSKNICRNVPKHHVSLGSTGGTEPPSARAAVLILCPRMS